MQGRDYKRTPRRKPQPRQRLLPAWFWMLVGFVPPTIVAILIYLDKLDVRSQNPHSGSAQLQATVKKKVKQPSTSKNDGTHKVLVSKKPDNSINFIYKKELKSDVVLSSDFSHPEKSKSKPRDKIQKNNKTKTKQQKIRQAKISQLKKVKSKVRKNNVKAKKDTTENKKKNKSAKAKTKHKNRRRFTKSYLQAGAFNKMSQAQTHRKRLARLGVKASVLTVNNKGKSLYRIRIGPFTNSVAYKKNLHILTKNKIKAFRTNK